MVQDPNFINPFTNPILTPVINRFILVFLMGFVLIFLLNKLKLKGIWQGNLGKRYLSWLVIAAIYLIAVLFGGYVALAFLLVVMVLAIWEIAKLANLPKVYQYSLYLLAAVTIYVTSFHPDNFYMLPLLYFAVLGLVAIRKNDNKGLFNLSLSVYASIWIIFALSHFILLGHLNNDIDNTKSLLILVGFAVALADIGAYVIGKAFSKTFFNNYKIANNISQNKTYIGVLGSIIGAGLGIWVMYFAISSYMSLDNWIVLAVLIGIFAQVGDLSESLFKSYFNKKDSSNLIPGHGGILDRIDSVLRVILVVYYYIFFILLIQ